MILITQEEKQVIQEKFPEVYITRTMKRDSKRHHYYCSEDRRVMAFLRKRKNRSQKAVENPKRGGIK